MTQTIKDCFARQLPFWEHLQPSDQQLLCEKSYLAEYTAGQNVHGSNNDCLGILLIQSGNLRVYLLSEEGKDVTVYHLKEKDVCVLAASCMLDSVNFDIQIDAETNTEVILIPVDIFSALAMRNIYVENYSYKAANERFSDMINAVQRMLFLTLEQRLAAFLIDESAESGKLDIDLTHEKIARSIGSAREAVSRILKQMAADGSVELYRGGVHIQDKNRLYSILNSSK